MPVIVLLLVGLLVALAILVPFLFPGIVLVFLGAVVYRAIEHHRHHDQGLQPH